MLSRMSSIIVYALLAILLTVMIVQAFPVDCSVAKKEGFEDAMDATKFSCPQGSRSFITENGDLQCCSGIVNGRKCEGSVVCTFSSNATSTSIPFCGAIPRFTPTVQQLLSPPDRGVTVTAEEVNQGTAFFQNVFNVIHWYTLDALVADATPQDQKDEIKKLYEQEKLWKTTYAAKVDNTALAKEAKYAFEELKKTKKWRSVNNWNELANEMYPLLVKNDKAFTERVRTTIASLETQATQKKITLP